MAKIQSLLKRPEIQLFLLGLGLLAVLLAVYWNHFDNDFQFDDSHTIVNNTYIRDLSNIPAFFKDNTMMSTNVGNRSYRPIVITLNAIDYSIGGLDPFWFHVSIFTSYILLIALLFFSIRKLYIPVFEESWVNLVAFLTTAFFALHTANAETINYIIARSDSFSTLCLVAMLLMYQHHFTRKTHLYLLPLLLALYTKQVGVVGIFILFLYSYFIENNLRIRDLIKRDKTRLVINSFVKILPALIVGLAVFAINQFGMTSGPSANLLKETPVSRWDYFTTQWYVLAHYLGNFILPINLSADPDIKVIKQFWDSRKIFGLLVNAVLLYLAYRASDHAKYRPAAFGILWFYITLAPTSTFHPLGQVSNDHRTFLPFIGLAIAAGTTVGQLCYQFKEKILGNNQNRILVILLLTIILGGHAYGTFQRNIIWDNSDLLWKDVAEKSPENGRGLMNFGLTLMSKGDYKGALSYFKRTDSLMPNYSYLQINMGVLRNAMGDKIEAEAYFKKALSLNPTNAEAYYYYVRFLVSEGRFDLAREFVSRGLLIVPGHGGLNRFKAYLSKLPEEQKTLPNNLEDKLNGNGSVNDFINLSLQFYNLGEFEKCISACMRALEMNPKSHQAYNNICISNIRLNKVDEAIEAGEKAVRLAPDFGLAKNNLAWAKSLKSQGK